jgi:3-phosphoshikimate 1-carboxyvinyltransferase
MDIRITPKKLSGSVTPPPSKSMAHRLIISAALGSGVSTIRNVAFSQDIEATLRCMEALGAKWNLKSKDIVEVVGIGRPSPDSFSSLPRFDCGESGSTLRFLIPIALAVAGGGVFTGRGRLMERPQKPYFDLFDEKGIFWKQENGILTVQGRLTPGEYRLPGNVSSQFFTGLLFALSLLDAPSEIISTTALESSNYIDMTLQAMEIAGIPVNSVRNQNHFTIHPADYRSFENTVEPDWSQAGFWYAANFLDNPVEIQGMNAYSTQGDMIIAKYYWLLARPGDTEIDISGCPDLLPPLAVMAAIRSGTTRFINAARLRIKESDRLATVAALLQAIGCSAEELPDALIVHGNPHLSGGTVDGANDHRIVMAAAIAATACSAPVTILGAEAVKKSYPDFWEEYQRLGGDIHVL